MEPLFFDHRNFFYELAFIGKNAGIQFAYLVSDK